MLKEVCHPHDFYQKNCQIPHSIILIFKITFLLNQKVRKNLNSGLFFIFFTKFILHSSHQRCNLPQRKVSSQWFPK